MHDAFFTNLAAIDSGAWLRRRVADAQGTVVALLAAEEAADAADTLSEVTGRPARTLIPNRWPRVGARTTPASTRSMVCDIGGGTVDLIGDEKTVVARGRGSRSPSRSPRARIPQALAETVETHTGGAGGGPARRARGGRARCS